MTRQATRYPPITVTAALLVGAAVAVLLGVYGGLHEPPTAR